MLRIGIVGLSEGNGHPYSWSAIFNGFDKTKDCPFEVIPEYLGKQIFPKDFLSDLGKVTHIYTQDRKISEKVAEFALIDNIVDRPEEMINNIDVVLLARDDAENHYEMAKVFIENGIPIFIDKPLAYNIKEAEKIYSINENSLIYTCSSVRFAKEFSKRYSTNQFKYVEASIMKDWNKYAIHLIEPIVNIFPGRGDLIRVNKIDAPNNVKIRVVQWRNLTVNFKVTGKLKSPLCLSLINESEIVNLNFEDSFSAFKGSLKNFIGVVKNEKENISLKETLEIIKIIELGI